MKTLITFIAVTTLFSANTFAQYNKLDRLDNEAKKRTVAISREEWKAAMIMYRAEVQKTTQVTTELEFLKYRTTLLDYSIADLEKRKPRYEATLNDPNGSVAADAQAQLDRLNSEIEKLKAEKTVREETYNQAQKESIGTYKTIAEIDAELAKTKEIITNRMEPFKATGDQAEQLKNIFLQQDMKYTAEPKQDAKDDAQYKTREYLNKKYPPQSMFRSEVTNFYSYQENNIHKTQTKTNTDVAIKGNNNSKSTPNQDTSNENNSNQIVSKPNSNVAIEENGAKLDFAVLEPVDARFASKTDSSKNNRGKNKKDKSDAANEVSTAESKVATDTTSTTAKNTFSSDPATNRKIEQFNNNQAIINKNASPTDTTNTTAAPVNTNSANAVVTPVAHSACDQAEVEVVQALLKDPKNAGIFAKMMKITTLKMAYQMTTDAGKKKTLEEYANSLDLSQTKADESFQNSIKQMYESYGAPSDKMTLENLGVKKADYYKSTLRFTNDNASALALFLSQKSDKTNPMSINVDDAANLWAQQKVYIAKGHKVGASSNDNLLNFSSQVFHTLGLGGQKSAPTAEALKAKYDATNSDIQKAMLAAVKSVTDADSTKRACFIDENGKLCEPQTTSIGSESISKIQKRLTQLISKGSLVVNDVTLDLDMSTAIVTKNGVIEIKPTPAKTTK